MNNSDRLYSYGELNDDKLKEFAEGSESLYQLLSFCYTHHIPTHACCKGHNDQISKPYISFKVNDKDLMIMVMNNILSSEISSKVFCEISDYNYLHLAFYIQDVDDSDLLFDHLLKSFNKSPNNKYYYIFDLFEKIRIDSSEISSIIIFDDYIEISNPIYKKIMIKNQEPIYTDENPDPGDMLWQENNRKLYLPDDVVMDDIPNHKIIRDDDIFKDKIEISNSIVIDDEFILEFYDKINKHFNNRKR